MLAKRIKIWLLCILDFSCVIFWYLELGLLGFPDGYLSQLDLARQISYPVLIMLGLAFLLYILFLATKIRQPSLNRQINLCYCAYFLFLLSYFSVDYWLSKFLNHGTGT